MLRRTRKGANLALVLALTGLISTQVFAQTFNGETTTIGSTTVTRMGGQDRYGTAVKVADSTTFSSKTVILASGENFPDAVCSAALTKVVDAPILLTTANSLPENTVSEIKKLGATKVYILGGTGVLTQSAVNQLKELGITDIERLGGQDRFETSTKLAKFATGADVDNSTAFIVNGDDYASALSVAPVAAMYKMPILLTSKDTLPNVVKVFLSQHNIKTSYVVGGTNLVSDNVLNQLPGTKKRIDGTTKYDINANVLKEFLVNGSNTQTPMSNSKVFIASGEAFADALGVSALAGREGNPIVLVNTTTPDIINATTKETLKTAQNGSKETYVLGLQGAVSDVGLSKLMSTTTTTTNPTNPTNPTSPTSDVDAKANQIISSIIKPGMTDVQKEYAIYNYLIHNVKYDYSMKKSDIYEAKGALINNVAVCEGFAKAFKLLCDKVGLEAIYVHGTASGVNHGINMVKLEGQWYGVDTTFAEGAYEEVLESPSMCESNIYTYFNMTDSDMNSYLTWNSNVKCTSTKWSYENYIKVYGK